MIWDAMSLTYHHCNNVIVNIITVAPGEHHAVLNQRHFDCLFNGLFRLATEKCLRYVLLAMCRAPNNTRLYMVVIFDTFLCDYKARQDILLRAKHLKGTQFSINQDFPPEIRTARGQLWDDYKRARSEKLKAKIAFPAKLVVEGQVVRDLFPMWGNWARSSTPTQYDDRAASQEPPRSGAPMQVAMADLIGAAPFKPRNNPANPNNAPTPQHAPVPNYSTHPSSSTGARPKTADTLAPYATDTRLPLPQRPVPPLRPRHHHAVSHRPSMAQPHAISQ